MNGKRKRLLGIILIVIFMGMSGCATEKVSDEKYKEIDYDSIDYKNEQSSFLEREKEIVVVTEESLENEVHAVALWYMRSQEEVKVTIEVLSQDKEERTGQLQEMRTEIMAGKGPDVYLLNSPSSIALQEDQHELLFANVNKTIESGLFEDLDEYMNEDSFWSNHPIADAFLTMGQIDEKQYVLPLSCEYYVLVGKNTEKIEMGDTIEEWMQTIRVSEDAILKKNCSLLDMYAAWFLMPAIDYEEQEVLFDKEKWISLVTDQFIPYSQELSKIGSVSEEQYAVWNIQLVVGSASQNEYVMCETLPGLNGERIATVKTWGAIGRNSDHKQNAYDFLMLFLNNYVLEDNKEQTEGNYRYPGVDGCIGQGYLPVYQEAIEQYLLGMGLPESQIALIVDSFNQIDYTCIPTEVENAVYEEVMEKVTFNFEEKTEEEWKAVVTEIADMAEDKYEMIAKE